MSPAEKRTEECDEKQEEYVSDKKDEIVPWRQREYLPLNSQNKPMDSINKKQFQIEKCFAITLFAIYILTGHHCDFAMMFKNDEYGGRYK